MKYLIIKEETIVNEYEIEANSPEEALAYLKNDNFDGSAKEVYGKGDRSYFVKEMK